MTTPTKELLKPIINELLGEAAFLYIAKARRLQEEKNIDVISFGVGQPDIPTFDYIVEAAVEALREKFTGYTETAGIPELRRAIAHYLNERYNAGVDEDEVIVTTGAKTAIFLAIASYIDIGDEIIVPEPSYPAYPEIARALGGKPVYVKLAWKGQDKGFHLDIEKIEQAITNKTKIIVINNPHNPTGTLFDKNQLDELIEIARKKKLLILSDEIYDNFVYSSKFYSILEYPDWKDYVLYVNGFSKTYSMTGWRLGYLVVRREIAEKLKKLAVNIYSCPPSIAQKAGVAALNGPQTDRNKMIEEFRRRRDVIVEELRKIPGFEVATPKGAFYVFPRITKILEEAKISTEQFADNLLYNQGVVVLPGTVFPDKAGEGYLRLSYAVSTSKIKEGITRIKREVEKITSRQ